MILGESWREQDSPDYLCAEFGHKVESYSHEHGGSVEDGDNEDDDANSINSFSTTATASNLPGAGRTIDTYVYQPVGRRVERLAKRFTTPPLYKRPGM